MCYHKNTLLWIEEEQKQVSIIFVYTCNLTETQQHRPENSEQSEKNSNNVALKNSAQEGVLFKIISDEDRDPLVSFTNKNPTEVCPNSAEMHHQKSAANWTDPRINLQRFYLEQKAVNGDDARLLLFSNQLQVPCAAAG